ncbi:hypothetical protein [Lihuaxuella thermophila]|nr:hypothetical protein [Lihuaxuella thermophila]
MKALARVGASIGVVEVLSGIKQLSFGACFMPVFIFAGNKRGLSNAEG